MRETNKMKLLKVEYRETTKVDHPDSLEQILVKARGAVII